MDSSSDGIIKGIKQNEVEFYKNYVNNLLQTRKQEIRKNNQIQSNEERFLYFDETSSSIFNKYKNGTQLIVPYENHTNRIAQINLDYVKLNSKQKEAFDIICEHLTSNSTTDSNVQLKMFITGEGGTGKSKVIEMAIEFAKLYFGKQHGIYGPALPLAGTGTAAKNIGGFTYHSVFNKGHSGRNGSSHFDNDKAQNVGSKILGVKLIIIDEISLLSFESIHDIHTYIVGALLATLSPNTANYEQRKIEINSQPFGGLHVLFCGDFYQLKCMGGTALYTPIDQIKTAKAKGGHEKVWTQISSFIELTENMRVATASSQNSSNISEDDKDFIEFLSDARIGNIYSERFQQFINKLNKNNLVDFDTDADKAHPNALWISNKKDDARKMNDAKLEELKKQGKSVVRIIAHHTPTSSSLPPPDEDKSKILYSLTPETVGRNYNTPTFMDLCVGSMIMLTNNIGTEIGLTNGTMGEIIAFGYEGDTNISSECFDSSDFHKINPYNRKAPIVFVKFPTMTINDTAVVGIEKVVPITLQRNKFETFKAGGTKYFRWQMPFIPAFALNTHKVQGLTAHDGVVYKPTPLQEKPFARSLEYVAISRCPSVKKLILLKPLEKYQFRCRETEFEMIKSAYEIFRQNY